jgi:hypothetical protein
MMIEETVIDEINSLLMDRGLDEAAVGELRNNWPNIHFTYCSDDDVCGPPAIRESEAFSIYLIDGRDHCLSFTSSTEAATGLVLAEHEQDFY